MKILVLGSGGREHALANTFHRQGYQVYCLPGNGGTKTFCEPISSEWNSFHLDEHERLLEFIEQYKITLSVVGPEMPLANGIVDFLQKHDVRVFGPTKTGAQLESSKMRAKSFMHAHQIPTAASFACNNSQEALDVIHRQFPKWNGLVIKPDGLTAGKGVTLCKTLQEAHEAIDLIMEVGKYGNAGRRIIVEEMLTGPEISILAFSDGNIMIPMIPSQDHKKLLDGDKGPNTGGVGAYAPVPFIKEQDLQIIHQEIIEKTNLGLKKEGISYKGILYFGLILTASGPKVLEFNCRFGDPEAQVVLPLLESDLKEIMSACIDGKLHELPPLKWKNKWACGVVIYSKGYPREYKTGYPINGLENTKKISGLHIFHSGTKINLEGSLVTSGGRVLTITALEDSLMKSIEKSYRGAAHIDFEGAAFRKDIAHQACK